MQFIRRVLWPDHYATSLIGECWELIDYQQSTVSDPESIPTEEYHIIHVLINIGPASSRNKDFSISAL